MKEQLDISELCIKRLLKFIILQNKYILIKLTLKSDMATCIFKKFIFQKNSLLIPNYFIDLL